MTYLTICLVSLVASCLTFFTGFGLGTILMPVFALFFPIEIAIAMTAIVHMGNNIFKLFLIGDKADKLVLKKFAPPAILFALIGSWLLTLLTDIPIITTYVIGQREFQVTFVKIVIGLLLVIFAGFELLPHFEKIKFADKYLPVGGAISGFFGGLSGHQGALRSAFLSKAINDKEAFIATGAVVALLVDLTRIPVYAGHITKVGLLDNWQLVLAATVTAFAGAFVGARLIKKVTLKLLQAIVGFMLVLMGLLLCVGLI
ncbi:MAG: sulfite exporter TauE/SafE family protein [Acidaminococcaceae bacterium]